MCVTLMFVQCISLDMKKMCIFGQVLCGVNCAEDTSDADFSILYAEFFFFFKIFFFFFCIIFFNIDGA